MESFCIDDNKIFMAKLLKGECFDEFEVREIVLHTAVKSIIEGKRNLEFFERDNRESLSEFISWQELKPYVYSLVAGKTLPTFFKIIFSTSPSKTLEISTEVSAFMLNITYKDNEIICTTGCAYKTFLLDKTPEQLWDNQVKNFLFEQKFI
ncbi:MAG: hypothetical protein ATN36_05215 [Epulopiscium sp. Nele67-Bin005]|nr:MAG: hypothetical protein ATN36_05215 [Epulopiscium sp. Nele67-Bin005]